MNEPFKIRHARPIVIASTIAVLAMIGGVGLVRYARATTANNTYRIHADQAQLRGLRKTMDVKILGETVGVVTDVRYLDEHPSHVEVEFTVNEPKRHKLFANSRVIVGRTLAVGTAHLAIERATDMLGMIVRNLSNDEANQMGTRGVKVVEIARGSPASMFETSLIDQVITSINGKPVEDVGSYYQLMGDVVPGSEVPVGLHAIDNDVTLDAKMVSSHRVLQDGAIVQQFEPEESSVQTITEKITLVQESIANVENSVVSSLTQTDDNVSKSIVPAFDSITSTSDAIREQTLSKANSVLDRSNATLDHLDQTADQISESFVDMINDNAAPAFNRFAIASKSLETASTEVRETVDIVGDDTKLAIDKLTVAIETLQEVLEKSRVVADTLQREAQDLPGTTNQINATMQTINTTAQKAQTTIDGVNNHWLLRRSIKRSQNQKSGQPTKTGPIRKLFSR